jgi:hypothetical protein
MVKFRVTNVVIDADDLDLILVGFEQVPAGWTRPWDIQSDAGR